MQAKIFSSRVLREAASERRRVLSDWRVGIYARRIARAENIPLPDAKRSSAILEELIQRRDVKSAGGVDGVYIVDVPYANLLEISEEQVIQEANPWAVFGFLTAMVYHGLTDLRPTSVQAIRFKGGEHVRKVPLGTTPEDWVDLRFPEPRQPKRYGDSEVFWTELQGKREFGVTIGYSFGLPIYITDTERTLVDALRMPKKCGGVEKVFTAWRDAVNSEEADIEKIINYIENYNIKIMNQRIGFVLEKLGCKHPKLDAWRTRLQRGGSVKLVAGSPYSGTFSAEWNLSLNVPPSVLAILE